MGIAGALLFIACSWIFGAIGAGMGIVMTVIGLAKKYCARIWMPILSAFMGVFPFLGVILILMLISA